MNWNDNNKNSQFPFVVIESIKRLLKLLKLNNIKIDYMLDIHGSSIKLI